MDYSYGDWDKKTMGVLHANICCGQCQANIGDKLPGGESDPLVGRTGSGSTVGCTYLHIYNLGDFEAETSVDIVQN